MGSRTQISPRLKLQEHDGFVRVTIDGVHYDLDLAKANKVRTFLQYWIKGNHNGGDKVIS